MFDSLEDAIAAIEAEGYDPDLVLPLYDLIAESAAIGVQARMSEDMVGTMLAYGRVSGIFDALLVLGLPAPADSPATVMLVAESVLGGGDLADLGIEVIASGDNA